MAGATRSIVINAPVDKCYAVICDVERYPEFLPEVKEIRTSNKKGNEFDAHYKAEVVKLIKYTVRIKMDPPNKLSWTYVDGEFMKDNKGGWVLEDQGNGTTKATYSIEISVGPLVPKSIITALTDSQLPKLLENFKKRIEAQK